MRKSRSCSETAETVDTVHRIIAKILLWIFVVAVLLAGAIAACTILLKDRLLQYGIQAINNELNAPVQVEGINVSLINSFPYASIVMNKVTVMSPERGFSHSGFSHTSADTLLSVRKVSLSFNTRKLFDNELELNSVKFSDGRIYILIDSKGNDNFHILKEKKAKADSAEMLVQLEHIGFNDCIIQIENQYKGNGVEWVMPSFEAEGQLNNGQFEVKTKGTVNLQWIEANNVEIVPLAPTQIRTSLAFNNETLLISEGTLSSKGLNLEMTGSVSLKDDANVDLKINGQRIEVANALRYFTLATKEKPNVRSTGLVDFSATVNGKFDKRSTPLIVAKFGLENATVEFPKHGLSFTQVGLKGVFNNGGASRSAKSYVSITDLKLQTEHSKVSGDFRVDNLAKPYINTSLQVSGRLEEWNRFAFADGKSRMSGSFEGSFVAHGPASVNRKFDVPAFLKLNPACQAQVKSADYASDGAIELHNVTGTAILRGSSLNLIDVSGKLRDMPVSFNVNIDNLLKAVVEPYPTMHVDGVCAFANVDYGQIEPLLAGGKPNSKITYNVSMRMTLSQFTYGSFNASNILGRLRYAGNEVSVDGLKFSALGGSVDANAGYSISAPRLLTCRGNVSNIDINQMFSTFGNFGQSYITYQNVDGELSSSFSLQLPFAGDSVDKQHVSFDGKLKIVNGKLHGLEATNSIADFTKIDEFRALEFSTLSNDMSISGGNIFIPKMNIECNACDISLAGTHKFSGDYEYHLALIMSDFMRGKAKRLQQTTPYGIVEDDAGEHTSVYLVASRTGGKPKIRFDKVEMKQQFRQEMQQQKQEVKQILKKEFGLFKNDTTIKTDNNAPKPASSGFVIEWDEE